jgi:hypothetical protein
MSVASYLTSITPVPVGTLIYYAGQTVPRNYLLANGDTLLIADYPELYAVLGTTYGGDGVTNFDIPLLDVVVQGNDVNDPAVVPSTATGSTNVTLSLSNMPSLGAVGFSVVGGVGSASMDGGACSNQGNFAQGIGAEGKKVKSDSTQFGGDSSKLYLDEGTYGLRDGASCVFSMGSATPDPIAVSVSGTVTAPTLGLMPLIRYTNQLTRYSNIQNAPYIPQTNNNPLSNIPTLSGYIYSQ